MTNPFVPDPSALPEADLPSGTSEVAARRFSYASVASAAPSLTFISHPARTSVLSELLHFVASDSLHDSDTSAPSMDMDSERNGAGVNGASSRNTHPETMGTTPPLNSLSRAFELFSGGSAADGAGAAQKNGFFIPSYLKGSVFAQKLEEANKAKVLAQRDSQPLKTHTPSGLSASASSANLSKSSHSHRGLSFDVAEDPPPFEGEGALQSIPTKWNKHDKWQGGIDVLADDQEVRYTATKSAGDHETGSVRADHPIPPECGIYYFEITVFAGRKDDTTIGIGLSSKSVALSRPPGWESESFGYHGDDGHCFNAQSTGKTYGPKFTCGDTVGCGINFYSGTVFFTRNGVNLGVAFRDVLREGKGGKLYPSVGLKKPGEYIRANFGQTPFMFDIDTMVEREKSAIQKQIAETSTEKLAPNLNESELIQTLVLEFLQHDGYVETARAFAEEVQAEKQALSVTPGVPVEGVNIKDDQDAHNRQRIRRAILEGDMDKALKYTNTYYPQVLEENEQISFRLRCRRFIEMVRRAAEMGIRIEGKKSNGHLNDVPPQEMDLDTNGLDSGSYGERMVIEDAIDPSAELDQLERETLLYGQQLQAEYQNDQRREVSKALEDIWSLMAYANPLKEPRVAHLLDRKGRVGVAEELNSAILQSLGKSSRAALEQLYAQTSVLLEDLREDGGPGAFVSLHDIIRQIPKSQHY